MTGAANRFGPGLLVAIPAELHVGFHLTPENVKLLDRAVTGYAAGCARVGAMAEPDEIREKPHGLPLKLLAGGPRDRVSRLDDGAMTAQARRGLGDAHVLPAWPGLGVTGDAGHLLTANVQTVTERNWLRNSGLLGSGRRLP